MQAAALSRFKLPGTNRRRDQEQTAAAAAVTEKLPLLAEALQRTEARPRRVLMDFAPASPASLQTYQPLACRLRLLEFPELRIVAGHVGAPWTAEAISLAHKFPNVYLDSSAYKLSRLPAEFVAYLQASSAKG